MKQLVIFLSLFLFIFPAFAVELDIYSENAVLYNLDEDKILYEKNSSEVVAIASLTKIMTGIVAIENIPSLDEEVTLINSDFATLVENNASVAGFRVGQKLTYRDLLYGLLLPSGADAAQALTRLIAGGRTNFVKLMNEKALDLGMEETHFTNETGLDEEGQTSTVKDVAIMLKYALANPTLKEILMTPSYRLSDGSRTVYSTVYNSVHSLNQDLDYILGGKTGTTSKAGRCLASFAELNGVNFLLVTVRAPQGKTALNVVDAQTIYNYFLTNYVNATLIKQDEVFLSLPTQDATLKEVSFKAPEEITKYVPIDYNQKDVRLSYDGIDTIPFNTKKGSKLGTLSIYFQDEKIKDYTIILDTALTLDIGAFVMHHLGIIIGSIILFLIIIGVIVRLATRKRKKM